MTTRMTDAEKEKFGMSIIPAARPNFKKAEPTAEQKARWAQEEKDKAAARARWNALTPEQKKAEQEKIQAEIVAATVANPNIWN